MKATPLNASQHRPRSNVFSESFPDFPRNKRGEVTQQRVTDILTHPIYTGHICSETYGINWLPAQHEALISLEVFDKVQTRRKGVAKAPKRKNIGDQFALRGIALCACCDVPLHCHRENANVTGMQIVLAIGLSSSKAPAQ